MATLVTQENVSFPWEEYEPFHLRIPLTGWGVRFKNGFKFVSRIPPKSKTDITVSNELLEQHGLTIKREGFGPYSVLNIYQGDTLLIIKVAVTGKHWLEARIKKYNFQTGEVLGIPYLINRGCSCLNYNLDVLKTATGDKKLILRYSITTFLNFKKKGLIELISIN